MAIKHLAGTEDKTLYERLGGIFAIAGVVDYFSDALLKNPIVGTKSKNPQLREWSTKQSAERLPGLKWMRTLWACDATGGPYTYHATVEGSNKMDLSKAHAKLKITSEEFDEVANEMAKALDHFKVPKKEKDEVLAAFAAHKKEVVSAE